MSIQELNGQMYYQIIEKDFQGVKIFFYQDMQNLFLNENEWSDEMTQLFLKLFSMEGKDFRFQVTVNSVPFMLAYFNQDKEVRFYTPRMSTELFLLQQNEVLESNLPDLINLRKHVSKALQLSVKNFPTVIERITKAEGLPDLLNDARFVEVESRSAEITKKLLNQINTYNPSWFEDLTDFGLGLTAQFALLRIHLLKFLAILPSLDHDKSGVEVKRILMESLIRLLKDNKKAYQNNKKGQERALNSTYIFAFKSFLFFAKFIPANILATMVRKSVKIMAKRFIAGETIETADKSLQSLFQTGRDVTLDQLGELVVSEREADHYCNEVIKLIKGFSLHVKKGELNKAGIHRAHVSIKVSALCSDFKPHAPDYTYELVAPRLKKILLIAKEEDVFINIDAEHYHYRDIVFKIYKRLLLSTEELKSYHATGIVLQAYLRDASKHLNEIIELAKERNISMPVRIVKGAYWDAETVEGDAHSFNAPQFLNKEETDIHFRQLIVMIYKAHPHLKLCLASHNFSDHAFAEALKEKMFPQVLEIEHQCLHMTYEALSTALAKMGWATRNYVPVGSLIVGMAYLVRRIMENSSQVGVLTIMRSHKKGLNLQSPYEIHKTKKREGKIVRDVFEAKLDDEFFNITPARIYLDSERTAYQNDFEKFTKNSLGKTYENVYQLNGEWQEIKSSSNPDVLVGKIRFASVEDAEKMVALVDHTYNHSSFSKASLVFRASILLKVAFQMLCKRNELASLIMYEAGKSVNEALADVDEAIDFLNFYARTESYITKNSQGLISRGPIAVISPWNFPLAIPCGMLSAAFVAGNPVILKSAEQTPLISQVLVDLFLSAGAPKEAIIHLPGVGETVGDFLVKDKRISGVVFTGSKAVGIMIANSLQKRVYENKLYNSIYPTLAITEMGGKNAIIVTQNAELDETVSGILYSAFGHAGQKCSACSRVLVHHALKDKLIARLKEAVTDLKVGSAINFDTTVNPIISFQDKERIRTEAINAKIEVENFGGSVVIDRTTEDLIGYALAPAVFELPKERSLSKDSIAQKEIFGPILHIISFKDLDEAVSLFNSTDYALTGGIFSQSQDDIDYLSKKLLVGNLYVNRTITGARVAIEPFGGFKLSGTGPKAGSKHYVYSFHQIATRIPEITPVLPEEGHDDLLKMAKPSLLLLSSRIERMNSFLDQFIPSIESMTSSFSTSSRDVLKDYKKWVNKNLESFTFSDHKNRVIPGQLSFNNYEKSVEQAVVIAVNQKPQIKTIIQVLTGISAGTAMTIVIRNKEAQIFWTKFYDLLIQSGFSKENLVLLMPSHEKFKELLSDSSVSAYIFDGSLRDYDKHIGSFLVNSQNLKSMKFYLTIADNVHESDFYRMHLKFTLVRSFAVNTMRHGAPLDLEI